MTGRVRTAVLAVALASVACATPTMGAAPAGPGEIAISPDLAAMVSPVSCARYDDVVAWGERHGYRFPRGEGVCRRGPDSPAVALGWNTAAVWGNALSERTGLVPAYLDADGTVARDAVALGLVPAADPRSRGYRLPTLAELGLPRLRARMKRDVQEWSATRIDLGDGEPYYYLCRPGACDFHSSGMSGRGVAFRLVRTTAPRGRSAIPSRIHAFAARQPFAGIVASFRPSPR